MTMERVSSKIGYSLLGLRFLSVHGALKEGCSQCAGHLNLCRLSHPGTQARLLSCQGIRSHFQRRSG